MRKGRRSMLGTFITSHQASLSSPLPPAAWETSASAGTHGGPPKNPHWGEEHAACAGTTAAAASPDCPATTAKPRKRNFPSGAAPPPAEATAAPVPPQVTLWPSDPQEQQAGEMFLHGKAGKEPCTAGIPSPAITPAIKLPAVTN